MASDPTPSHWRIAKLAELGEVNRGRSRHRPRDASHLYGGPYPFVQTGDIKNSGGRITEYRQSYSEAGLAQSRLWPVGTMCITIAANIAETALLTFPACFPDSVVGFIADEDKCDVRFVEYVFRRLRQRIQSEASGSVQHNINLQTLAQLSFPIPPLYEQIEIADVLSALDDRIDNLRQTNATLEAIAQALFKSWFVDFDPVRAKAEGREPEGMDAATAALFPSEFGDSELGPIPKGWSLSRVGDIAELIKGCSYKGAGLSESDGAYMFNLGCFNAKRVFATENIKRYTGTYRDRQSVRQGDLIMANTDMTQQRDILGRSLFVPAGAEPGFISHHVFNVEIRRANADVWKRYLFFGFRQSAFRERAVGHATGTTVLALARDSAEQCPIIEPGADVLVSFDLVIAPLLRRIESNIDLAKNLEAIRDSLLPRLISGKLRLADFDHDLAD